MRVDQTEIQKIAGGLTPYIEPPIIRIHLGYDPTSGPELPSVDTWQLVARRLGSSVVSYSATVYGEDAEIPLNTFLSGYYYVFTGTAFHDTFTCKVLIP